MRPEAEVFDVNAFARDAVDTAEDEVAEAVLVSWAGGK